MNAYRITDWDKNYEVTKDGKPATEKSKTIRKAPLSYVRLAVQGHNPSLSFREMLQKANGKGMMVFGVFCKLLELAGNQPRELRGWLLDTKGFPMTAERIAFALCCSAGDIDFALQVLADKTIEWLVIDDFHCEQMQSDTEDKKDCSVIINETEENKTELNNNETQQQSLNKTKPAAGNIGNCLSDILLTVKNASSLNNSSSTSPASPDNWDWQKAKERWSLAMQRYFRRSNFSSSDSTTFFEMIKHLYEKCGPLTDELFNRAAALASEAATKRGVKNPIAYFVSRFKTVFGDFTR